MDNKDLIKQYVNTGLKITLNQFSQLSNQDKKTYLRARIIFLKTNMNEYHSNFLQSYELKAMSYEQKKEICESGVTFVCNLNSDILPEELYEIYLNKQFEKHHGLDSVEYKLASNELKKKYIDYKLECFESLSDKFYGLTPDELKQYYLSVLINRGIEISDKYYDDCNLENKKIYLQKIIDREKFISLGKFVYTPDDLKVKYLKLKEKYGIPIYKNEKEWLDNYLNNKNN